MKKKKIKQGGNKARPGWRGEKALMGDSRKVDEGVEKPSSGKRRKRTSEKPVTLGEIY